MKKINPLSILANIVLMFLAVTMVFCFALLVYASFKPNSELIKMPRGLLSSVFTIDNYIQVFSRLDFARLIMNSAFVTIIKVIIVVYTSAISAYVLEKMKFKGQNILFFMILSTMMIPWIVTIVPRYQMMSWFGWQDSYFALVVPFACDAFGIFMIKSFLKGVPDYFVEAGRIDGASEFYIFHKLIIPEIKGSIITLAILKIIEFWNDFMWPFLILKSSKKFTLPIGLQSLSNSYWNDFSWLLTGIVISMIPALIIYLLFRDKIIEGIALGGLAN